MQKLMWLKNASFKGNQNLCDVVLKKFKVERVKVESVRREIKLNKSYQLLLLHIKTDRTVINSQRKI